MKRKLFGCISYGLSVVLLGLLIGSAVWNWMRTEALIRNVTGWAAQMQVVTVAQMHADRALALAETQTYRAEDLEDAGEDLIRKLHHLQVEHMGVIMKAELYGSIALEQADYIDLLTAYIKENGLPVPSPEVKECPPQPAKDASSYNSPRCMTRPPSDRLTFPGGTFQRNSTELDVSGMEGLHEACPLLVYPGLP